MSSSQASYRVQDLADHFGCSIRTIYNLTHQGVLPPANRRAFDGRHYSQQHFDRLKAYREAIPLPGERVTRACLAGRFKSGADTP